MVRAAVVFALSALAPLAAAQSIQVPDLPFNLTYKPDLNKVPADKRSDWCNGERAVCDTLCGAPDKYPTKNDCDSATLKYSCTCQNGSAPGLQYYQNSLPTFICEEAANQCILATVGDKTAQDKCNKDVRGQCGTQPAKAASGGAAPSSSSGTPAATQSGSNSAPSSSPPPKSAAAPNPLSHLAGIAGIALATSLLAAYAL